MWQAFGNTPRAFRLVWDCSWPATLAMAGLTLVAAALPVIRKTKEQIHQGGPPH